MNSIRSIRDQWKALAGTNSVLERFFQARFYETLNVCGVPEFYTPSKALQGYNVQVRRNPISGSATIMYSSNSLEALAKARTGIVSDLENQAVLAKRFNYNPN